MTTSEIISRFGGPVNLANYLGIRSQAVSLWASKDRIPMARVPELVRVSRLLRLGLRAEDMRPDIDWDALKGRR
jgi:DNA-binding transcriptional regulator YdaS (Cro superfamily)